MFWVLIKFVSKYSVTNISCGRRIPLWIFPVAVLRILMIISFYIKVLSLLPCGVSFIFSIFYFEADKRFILELFFTSIGVFKTIFYNMIFLNTTIEVKVFYRVFKKIIFYFTLSFSISIGRAYIFVYWRETKGMCIYLRSQFQIFSVFFLFTKYIYFYYCSVLETKSKMRKVLQIYFLIKYNTKLQRRKKKKDFSPMHYFATKN